MKFTANFYVRVLGALALGYVGWYFGRSNSLNPPTSEQQIGTLLLILSGLGLGLVLTPYINSAAAGIEQLATALANGNAGPLDWACASVSNATATARGCRPTRRKSSGVSERPSPNMMIARAMGRPTVVSAESMSGL